MGTSIVARRAVADRPSVRLEATRKVTAKSRGMVVVKSSRTAVKNLQALVDMVVKRNQATAARVLVDTVAQKA
ncbi:hypothetical protein P3342_013550 [Pyrenophora teres f. teres]|nr:hypothetical protein P3342_013550 [Pyrenophora teres f. teres]